MTALARPRAAAAAPALYAVVDLVRQRLGVPGHLHAIHRKM